MSDSFVYWTSGFVFGIVPVDNAMTVLLPPLFLSKGSVLYPLVR